MAALNVTADEEIINDENCSEAELNRTSGPVTSSGDGNSSQTDSGRSYTTSLLVERRYDLAVVGCAIVVMSVWLNAFLVNGLLRRGGRVVAGMARSSLLLNLVAGDWVQTTGGCGVLTVALICGRWPVADIGCHLCGLSTLIGHVVAYYTLASFIVERCVSMSRKLADMWKQCLGSVTSIAIATISRSRDRDTRRFVIFSVTTCWLASAIVALLSVSASSSPFSADADALICAFVDGRSSIAAVVTSLVVGCLLPVVVGVGVYRKYLAMAAVCESAAKRCSRRQSSLVRLAARLTRRSSRFSVVSAERHSVSSACEVVLRDVDVYTKRSHDDEISYEKKWTRMTAMLAAVSLLLTTPWYVTSVVAMLTRRQSHYEWSVMASLLSHVVVVLHPVCFITFWSRSRAGSWARPRRGRVSVCLPRTPTRLASLPGDRVVGRVPRTCRLHSAPECTMRGALAVQSAIPTQLGLAPIEEHSHARTTTVHRMTPCISSATPVDDEPASPTGSECPQLSPAAAAAAVTSPTDSGLCPTPLQQRLSPASSARSSPCKLERFFGEQLQSSDDATSRAHVTSGAMMTSSPRSRSLSPCPAATRVELGVVQLSRDPRILSTSHPQSTLSAPSQHRPIDIHQLTHIACE